MDPKLDSDNALAEKTRELAERLRPHARAIVMAVGGAAVALLAWLLVTSQTSAGRAQSWDAFLDALSSESQPLLVDSLGDVIRRYPGTTAAQWSEVVLADFAVSEGSDLLFSNREQGRQRLESAVNAYSAVLTDRPQGLLATRATFGLAKARECLGQIDDARRGYEAVATEQAVRGFTHLAKQRVAALNRSATKEWYDWFSAQTFTSPQPSVTGTAAALGDDQPSPASAESTKPAAAPAAE